MVKSDYRKDYVKVIKYSKIVDDYEAENGDVPTARKFEELGGSIFFIRKHFGSYSDFVEILGYDSIALRRHGAKYNVIDKKTNNVVMSGMIKEIHDKMFSQTKLSTFYRKLKTVAEKNKRTVYIRIGTRLLRKF